MRPEFDQLQATLRDISPVLYSYYEYLKHAGFTQEQSFQLVRDYQMVLTQKK